LGGGAILICWLFYSSFFNLGLSIDQFSHQFNNSMAKKLNKELIRYPIEQDFIGSHFGFQINEKTFIKGEVK
jgi:hypothetical protein